MTDFFSAPVGFIGLGSIGSPMALNLVTEGTPLLVWDEAFARCGVLAQAGAAVAKDLADVFRDCKVIFLLLADAKATDAVLARYDRRFGDRVRGRMLINTATPAPAYSVVLEADIRIAGGRFVEAAVWGSRRSAETGQLVATLAGRPEDVAFVWPLLAPICRDVILCGPVPNGLMTAAWLGHSKSAGSSRGPQDSTQCSRPRLATPANRLAEESQDG